jgi:hypothetical protein
MFIATFLLRGAFPFRALDVALGFAAFGKTTGMS